MTAELRVPPHDLDAESVLLAAVLLEPGALETVAEILKPEHLYAEANRRILEAALAVSARGQPPDLVSVAGELRDRERLAQVGGAAYLASLAQDVPSVVHLPAIARRVLEKWRLRQLIATCQKLAAEGYGDVGEPQAFLERAESEIYQIAHVVQQDEEKTIGACAATAYKSIEAGARRGGVRGYVTGLSALDTMLNGLQPGKLTVVAANPGMGKSVLAQTLARNVAKLSHNRVGVQIFSPEMTGEELGERAIASESHIDSMRFRGEMDAASWRDVQWAVNELGPLALWITDAGEVTVSMIRGRVRKRQQAFDRHDADGKPTARLGVVIVDYLQLLDVEQKKGQTREEAVGNATKALKVIAKAQRLHVIAISSLTKETDKRPNKRPQMNDLRDSGAVSFHADNILLLYRASYYTPGCTDPHVVECNIAKQRGGPTGMVRLAFNIKQSRFENLADYDGPRGEGLPMEAPAPHWSDPLDHLI